MRGVCVSGKQGNYYYYYQFLTNYHIYIQVRALSACG